MEALLRFRQEHGFSPMSHEPESGWLSQLECTEQIAEEAILFGKNLEDIEQAVQPEQPPHIQTDGKQRQREAIKKLAQGHKLQSETAQQQNM